MGSDPVSPTRMSRPAASPSLHRTPAGGTAPSRFPEDLLMKDSPSFQTPRPTRWRHQQGSAYVVALIVLFVLTLLGLSLTLITQTEVQIGANERTMTRVFYGADTGISTAVARALVSSDHTPQDLYLSDSGEALQTRILAGNFQGADPLTRIQVTPFHPIAMSPCNLCEINNAGSYGSGRAFQKINHAVTSRAQRYLIGSPGNLDDREPVGEDMITTMVVFQPWIHQPTAFDAIDQEAQLAKIRF